MESSGALEFLVSIVSNNDSTVAEESTIDEVLSILYGLQLSEAALKNLMAKMVIS